MFLFIKLRPNVTLWRFSVSLYLKLYFYEEETNTENLFWVEADVFGCIIQIEMMQPERSLSSSVLYLQKTRTCEHA